MDKTLDTMQRWGKGELTTMEADGELAKTMIHKTVMVYQDPVTEL